MDSDLEVLLKAMLNEIYAESVDGDVEAPTGYFGIILIPPPQDSFRVQLEEEFFHHYGNFDAQSAKVERPALGEGGYYIVVLSDQGILNYDGPFQDSADVTFTFSEFVDQYTEWSNS